MADLNPNDRNAIVIYKRSRSDNVEGNLFGKISSFHISNGDTPTCSKLEVQYKKNVTTLHNVHVGRVFVPKTYDTLRRTCSEPITKNFFIFEDTRVVGQRVFRGNVKQRLDCLHSYDINCVWQESNTYTDRKRQKRVVDNRPAYQIVSVISTTMEKFTIRPLLHQLIDLVFKRRDIVAKITREIIQTTLPPCKSYCIMAVRAFGDREWFRKLESEVSWAFKEWYLDELCPPYERKSLSALSCNTIFTLIRIVVVDPWKLCFSWRTDIPEMTQELTPTMLCGLADRVGISRHQTEIDSLLQVTRNPIFVAMRDAAESYILRNEFELAFPDQEQRNLLVQNDIVRIVSECSEEHVYLTNDYNIELELADAISTIVLPSRVDRAIVLPPEQRKWTDSLKLTDEQQLVVENALNSRFYLVCGKPGSGKTAAVLKAIKGSYANGNCVAAAFTGMASVHLHHKIGLGVTIHSIIDSAFRYQESSSDKPFKYAESSVLLLDEFSQVSAKLLLTLLKRMPWLTRLVFVGDYRQKYPPCGGASVIAALYRRFIGDTKLACDLQFSMRVQEGAGALLRNLDAMCAYNNGKAVSVDQFPKPRLMLEWSSNPLDTAHSFFFVPCKRPDVIVSVIRDALTQCGVQDLDVAESFAIVVHTNNLRQRIAERWFWLNPKFAEMFKGKPYPSQIFCVGEHIMFLQNANKWKHPNGMHSAAVSNGMIGTILDIFDVLDGKTCAGLNNDDDDDEDDVILHPVQHIAKDYKTSVSRTDAPRRSDCSLLKRWIHVKLLDGGIDITVCVDTYGLCNICRVPPATIAKFQGQEVETIVVVLDQQYENFSRRDLYTACSRASKRCIVVVADFVESPSQDVVRVCPSKFFETIVARTPLFAEKTQFHSRFTSKEKELLLL